MRERGYGARLFCSEADAPLDGLGTLRRMQLKVKRDADFKKLINAIRYRMHRGLTTELDAMGPKVQRHALR